MSDRSAAPSGRIPGVPAPWPPPLSWPAEALTDGVIRLDPLTDDDVGRVVVGCSDPDTQRWLPVPSPYTDDDARTFIGSRAEAAERGAELTLAFRGVDDGVLAGVVGLGQRGQPYEGSIGYWTTPDRRRRGWTGRAVRLMAGYVFATMPLRRLEIFIEPANASSRRVAELAGATFEGVRRNGMPAPHAGDALQFSLVPDDLGDDPAVQAAVG